MKWNLVYPLTFVGAVLLAVATGPTGPVLGDGSMDWGRFIDALTMRDDTYSSILYMVRMPRVFLAAIVGCALALSGAVMQALFRNPMADPYILGQSSGAALGAALVLAVMPAAYSFSPLASFAGAVLTILLVYGLGKGRRIEVMLLSGIAASSFLGALVMLLLFLMGEQLKSLFFWMLGGFGGAVWYQIYILLPLTVGTAAFILYRHRELNLILTGEETAEHLGLDVERFRLEMLVSTSILTGAAVAFSGIIGFVGLIVPHMVRIVVGPEHHRMLPATAFGGAAFLVLMDTLSRVVIVPAELPIGITTAMCGGPFFIYLLKRRYWSA